MLELVIFLGNHGREYAGNRHNAAWLLAEQLPFYTQLNWQKKFNGFFAALDRRELFNYRDSTRFPAGDNNSETEAQEKVVFLMPHTFMNRSGVAIKAAADFYRIKPQNILVIHDELELALGTAGLKFSGGLGGHNGLRSIKEMLGTADFWRYRIGIGRPEHRDISSWVLSDFSPEETPALEQVLDVSSRFFPSLLCTDPSVFIAEWKKNIIYSNKA